MKLMKVLALILSLATLLSFAACQGEESTGKKPGESQTTTNPNNDDSFPGYDVITVARALELCGEPGNLTTERYYIRGTVTKVTNAEYGAMIIADETGSIEVYGTYSADGSLRYADMTEKPYKGDEVLLYCTLQNYNGNKEIKSAWLIDFKSNQGDADVSDYTAATIAEARDAAEGAKLKLEGVVARITYANGMKPSGYILVDGTASIYVYDADTAQRVTIGNKVQIAASKTYWILDTEIGYAQTFGYKGCNQMESVTLISLDNGIYDFDKSWITESTVKEMLDTPVTEDITTQIFKVNALVRKAPGSGFVNYYFNDLDGTTGAYTYTQCNGSDFAWLDAFDGKICTVYLTILNAKSANAGCVYRVLPVAVSYDNYVFDLNGTAKHVVKYYGVDQFEASYGANPELVLTTSVSSELLGFAGATISYSSSDTAVIDFRTEDGETIMDCLTAGTADITITGSYNGTTYSETVTVTVTVPEQVDSVSVKDAIDAEKGETVTVKGIVGPSLVNKTGFYLIDESGMIAVLLSADEMSTVQLGQEVVLRGTRAVNTKGGSGYFGQSYLNSCEVVANYYGSHEYSTANLITGKTLKDIVELDLAVDHTTEVYAVPAIVKVIETPYYTSIKLVASDGTELLLYSSSASQYNWLKQFKDMELMMEIAPCNWNDKTDNYRGCVLAVYTEDGKICNELNFSN
ncbi:MAG: hypothetical protein IJW29_01385 [Clostridia bacterium]|nr:hypothetical protein [Clostridia bacterium]